METDFLRQALILLGAIVLVVPLMQRAGAGAVAGYLLAGLLIGPPVLGWISHQIGILNTLWIIVALIAMSGIASGAAKPIAGSRVGAGHH